MEGFRVSAGEWASVNLCCEGEGRDVPHSGPYFSAFLALASVPHGIENDKLR